MHDERVLIPAGAKVRGIVRSVDKAGNIDRTGKLTLAFDQVTVRGRTNPIRAMATQVFESRGIRDEGKDVVLEPGTIVHVRLDEPVRIM